MAYQTSSNDARRIVFHDLTPFIGRSAAIKRPREVTHFSFDDKHVCHPLSDISLRYYYPPFFDSPGESTQQSIDLSAGLESFIKYEEPDLHLDALLETIAAHELKTQSKLDTDIVTWRGMMTKIMTAPFDQYGEFEMNAINFDGTIYIEENRSARSADEGDKRQFGRFPLSTMMYWGYKFETLSTLPRPWAQCGRGEIENRIHDVVDTHAQYCSIVRTGIGNHSIVIGGEVDAVQGTKPRGDVSQQPGIPYVELKTSENFPPHNRKAAEKFERKMCRFWAQSFLLGVPKIVIGFRSAAGHLERLEEWETQQIPTFVQKRGLRTWDGNVCINFAAAFLDTLRATVQGGEEGGTWLIKRVKGAKEISIVKKSEMQEPNIVPASFRNHRATFMPAEGASRSD